MLVFFSLITALSETLQSHGRHRKRFCTYSLYIIQLLKNWEPFNKILIFNIIIILWKLKMEILACMCASFWTFLLREIYRHHQIFFQKCFKILNPTAFGFSFCFSSKSLALRSLPIGLSVLAPKSLDSLETVFYLAALQLTGKQNNKTKM